MRAIGYFSEFPTRKTSEGLNLDLENPRQSLSKQNDDFLSYCDTNGIEPAAAFIEALPAAGVNRNDTERMGLRQLLDYLDHPEKGFLKVVVATFSHLGVDAMEAVRAYFQITARGAQIVSLTEGELDELTVTTIWRDGNASENAGGRVRDAMRRRAIKGQVLGRPPYGYRIGAERRFEIVEDEAALVRHIFDLYTDEDLGIRRIVKRLNEEGFRTRRGGNWSMVTIRDLLRNRTYVGTYSRFGVRVPGNHPSIITESQFKAVQECMEKRRHPSAPPQPSQFLLSGLVFCGESGTRMIGVTRRQQWKRRDGDVVGNTYRYYQNEARTNQSIGQYYTRRADELEAEVVRHLTDETPGAVRSAILSAGNARGVAAETHVAEERVRSRMRSLDRRLSQKIRAAAEGRLLPEQLRESGQGIVGEYNHAENELISLERRAAAQASDTKRQQHQERQRDRVRTEWSRLSFKEQQILVRDLVESVVVEGDSVRTVLRP